MSAVKALSIASQQGQKIYTINQANINQVLPLLRHKAAVMQDVQDAVAAGKIVTISECMISTNGWTGSGYIIIDPLTGAGAYLIGGAADGAYAFGFTIGAVAGMALMQMMAAGGFALATVAEGTAMLVLIPELIAMLGIIAWFLYTIKDDSDAIDCFFSGIFDGIGLAGSLGGFGAVAGLNGGASFAAFVFSSLGWSGTVRSIPGSLKQCGVIE